MDLQEIILKVIIPSGIVTTILGITAKYFLDKKKSKNEWLRSKQPTINHLTIVLRDFEKVIDDQLSRQWELSYSRYEFPFETDLIEAVNDHLDELIALSLKTGTSGRELKKELTAFKEFIDNQDRISKNIAREILLKEGKNPDKEEYSQELFQLSQNQRFHEWELHLTNIGHYSSLLAFQLHKHSLENDTKRELKSLIGDAYWKKKFWSFFKRENYQYYF